MNNKYKVVWIERMGDTVLTDAKYTSVLDDARELFDRCKANINVVTVSLWINGLELEKFVRNKSKNDIQ